MSVEGSILSSGTGEKKPRNVDIVETPHATFRVIRSNHDVPNTKAELGRATVVCVENQAHDYTAGYKPEKISAIENIKILIHESVQFSEWRNSSQIESLYITDSFDVGGLTEKIHNEFFKARRGLVFGAIPAVFGLMEMLKPQTSDKVIGAGLLGIGAYLARAKASEFLIADGYKGDTLTKIERETALVGVAIRNLIIAHKADFAAKREYRKTGNKKDVALAVGSDHGLVTEVLKLSSTDRENYFVELLNEAKAQGKLSEVELKHLEEFFHKVPYLNAQTGEIEMLDTRYDK